MGGIALLLFGGKKLPEMMRGLGQGVKEFKQGMNDIKNEPEQSTEEGENDPSNGSEETLEKKDGDQ